MTLRSRRALRPVALFVAAGALLLVPEGEARAFDPFGLFRSDADVPPALSAVGIAYSLHFGGVADADLLQTLKDVSVLQRLGKEPPPDGASLVRRAEGDRTRFIEALAGSGYYDGRVGLSVGGIQLGGDAAAAAAARRADAGRARSVVPVDVAVEAGTLYRLRTVDVRDPAGRAFPDEVLPERIARAAQGVPARSAAVLALEARLVDRLRAEGHPFAKAIGRDPVVDHRAGAMDVALTLDPGPKAGLGAVTVRGTRDVDPAVVRSFIYTEPGDPYSPRALAALRRSVARLEALGSVRVREGGALDADGNLPILVDVTERKPNLVGVSARYATVDGPGARAYWANRNLFGGGETLRLDADVGYFGLGDDAYARQRRLASFDSRGPSGRLGATFVKPALWGGRDDLVVGASVGREATQSYRSDAAAASIGIRHRWTDTISTQVGIEGQAGTARDALGRVDYRLVGIPVSLAYDSTDDPLDPTRGLRLTASATPYPAFLGSDPAIVVARAQGSGYLALDDDARTVLAARVGFGSVSGASLAEIPASLRFLAGGGGSVRGFAYKTIGPRGPFNLPVGGRSLLDGSVEARIKITDTIGLVPFVDAGTAFRSSLPDFEDQRLRVAAGLGLRYYTGFGPIRVDVAVPLDRVKGNHERAVALYISIGQAF